MTVFTVAEVQCDVCGDDGESTGLYAGFDIITVLKQENPGWKITRKEAICPECKDKVV